MSSEDQWPGLDTDARDVMWHLGAFLPLNDPNRAEVKGWLYDPDDGSTTKTYWNAAYLRTIAEALRRTADWLEERKPLPAGACPDCRGTGDMNLNRQERVWDVCEACGGSGEVPRG